MSKNQIEDLDPLKHLNDLLTLDASENQLTDVLGYDVPLCDRESAWTDGDGWIGSTLIRADLSRNKIRHLRDLSHHMYLRQLILDGNLITTITGLSQLKHLKVCRFLIY